MKRKETKEYRKIFDEARDIIELLSHTTSYLQEAVLQELLDASIYHDRSYVLLYTNHWHLCLQISTFLDQSRRSIDHDGFCRDEA